MIILNNWNLKLLKLQLFCHIYNRFWKINVSTDSRLVWKFRTDYQLLFPEQNIL